MKTAVIFVCCVEDYIPFLPVAKAFIDKKMKSAIFILYCICSVKRNSEYLSKHILYTRYIPKCQDKLSYDFVDKVELFLYFLKHILFNQQLSVYKRKTCMSSRMEWNEVFDTLT